MNDRDVITRILDLHDHLEAPAAPVDADVRRGERLVRRRRAAVAAVAAAAATVLVVGVVTLQQPGERRTEQPVQEPSPSPTVGDGWAPERVVAAGGPADSGGRDHVSIETASGLTVTRYAVCGGTVCRPTTPTEDVDHVALEVSRDGQSATFVVDGGDPWVTALDDDTALVQDAAGPDDPIGYRLLRADGTEVPLRLVDDPVPAAPGPGVVSIEDWRTWTTGIMIPGERLFRVDEEAGTLRPLAVPRDVSVADWGPNADEALWGVDACRVSWQLPDGSFTEQQAGPCGRNPYTYLPADALPEGWLQPGRMLFVEEVEGELTLHVTLDGGDTWRRVRIPSDYAIPATLENLG